MSFRRGGIDHSLSKSEEFVPDESEELEDEDEADKDFSESGTEEDTDKARTRAVRTACNILAYADNSERRLRRKLHDREYTSDAIEYAVQYVKDKGFLNEPRMVDSCVRNLTERKLYGLRRVMQELRVKEFSREAVEQFDFDEIDFYAVCERLYVKIRGGDDDKTRAAMLRYGHTMSDINRVIREDCS